MSGYPEDIHALVIRPVLGDFLGKPGFRQLVEQGLKTLPRRYPGLRVVRQDIGSDCIELSLDLHRIDEDLQRIIQSFKSEVGNLARAQGLAEGNLWQWSYEER